jgi:hypothetical protein
MTYIASLLFTLKIHRHLFAGEAHNASDFGESTLDQTCLHYSARL